ncbi:MAG: DNA primase large subunit PriL [Candidatus Bathyarchaeota archaeon]|nr:DNA primase large subunit PriL [Candidatus Termiticorpusculum sp.]MCL2868377.1 DNA primase large subunit PriL [Candidatus Termiticorpusculum sp.]
MANNRNSPTIQHTSFTKNHLAIYPFLKETAQYLAPLDLQIEELTSPGMQQILDRAIERVTTAITDLTIRPLNGKQGKYIIKDPQKEIISFPVALMLVSAIDNSIIKKRYALAEAKQATRELFFESNDLILKIASDFEWNITLTPFDSIFEFVLYFSDFLQNASHLHDAKWKLVNSKLSEGKIYLNKYDIARLLQEEIKQRIEKRLNNVSIGKYPPEISTIAEKLKTLATDHIKHTDTDFPKIVIQEAFPPCINALYDAASKNHHLSHIGRFALTAFLVNIGMSAETVTELFKSFSDYNERLTQYQVEHIAGGRGSGTKYTCPQCSILQTHNVCKNRDELCKRVYHPLKYYKIKSETTIQNQPENINGKNNQKQLTTNQLKH